ncbi:MAG: FAD-dependent oxidoreductase [Eubacteriales bacterium]|jgi:NAD(P)H-nitrite reductase large subunit|nr:FAD-dependent oxidoreductase [Eubacteriales bacterium]HPF18744.1 FAD-dependent oxidoreductase [Bacillota bacterium]
MNREYTYVVLGNGNAGFTAAKTIRENDKTGSILILSEESVLTYSRPMLTKTPLRTYDLKKTILYPNAWYEDKEIDVLLDTKIDRLDVELKQVHCGQEKYSYDKCIYALGAYNFIPPIKGSDKKEVTSIRTYEDIYRLKRMSVDADHAVVIGGGVIGLEAASELTKYGIKVVVLEALPVLMPRLLDDETANTLQKTIRSFEIHTDVAVEEIAGEERVQEVRLKDGRVFPADLVVVSAGVRANIRIAKDAGIECDRAVVINERAETSAPDVFACGDCCEYNGANYALWSQAAEQGIAAGTNAAGGDVRMGVIDSSMTLNTDEISIFAVGDTGKNPELTYKTEITNNMEPEQFGVNPTYLKSFEKRFYANGKLVGATIIGNLTRSQVLKEEILGIKKDGTAK